MRGSPFVMAMSARAGDEPETGRELTKRYPRLRNHGLPEDSCGVRQELHDQPVVLGACRGRDVVEGQVTRVQTEALVSPQPTVIGVRERKHDLVHVKQDHALRRMGHAGSIGPARTGEGASHLNRKGSNIRHRTGQQPPRCQPQAASAELLRRLQSVSQVRQRPVLQRSPQSSSSLSDGRI